jgi:hypothetical protein
MVLKDETHCLRTFFAALFMVSLIHYPVNGYVSGEGGDYV